MQTLKLIDYLEIDELVQTALKLMAFIPREGKHYADGHSACCTKLTVQDVNAEISRSV